METFPVYTTSYTRTPRTVSTSNYPWCPTSRTFISPSFATGLRTSVRRPSVSPYVTRTVYYNVNPRQVYRVIHLVHPIMFPTLNRLGRVPTGPKRNECRLQNRPSQVYYVDGFKTVCKRGHSRLECRPKS